MKPTDLLFITCFFAAGIALCSAAVTAIRGDRIRALRKLRKLTICSVLYMVVVLVVALVTPRKIYHLGETRCFDDWCIAVVSFAHESKSVAVDLRLSSRARRAPQGEKGTVVYLVDSDGNRYNPTIDSGTVPFATLLAPGESIITSRHFAVSKEARNLSLVYTHEGGFPIGSFIIGENTWVHGPPVVQLE